MITLHFHLQPQFKYELFHTYFTSFHCTGRYELNKLTSVPMCGFIAQLVEYRTGITEVTGSKSWFFFGILLSNRPFHSCQLGDLAFEWLARLEVTLFWYRPHCFCCVNQVVLMLTRCIIFYTTEAERSVSKQGHLRLPCCHSHWVDNCKIMVYCLNWKIYYHDHSSLSDFLMVIMANSIAHI